MIDLIDRDAALGSIERALNNATGDLYDAYAALRALPAATAADHCRALLEVGVFADPVVVTALRGVVEGK